MYGEYSRIDLTTPFEDLHVRADSYGMPGIQVDGMSLATVTPVLQSAIDRARSGEGPTLVEAKTYRFAGHSRADTAPYRPDGELEYWQQRDPLLVTRQEIVASGTASEVDLDAADQQMRASLGELVADLTSAQPPAVEDMFRNVSSREVHA